LAWLNFHHLLYFRTIANEGGVSKAAAKLHVAQSALSTQLRQLEESVGKQLFERRNRTLVLTEAGRVTLDYANQIFGLGDELLTVLKSGALLDKVRLVVGVLDSVPKVCAMQIAQEALRAAPCQVSLLEGKADELFRDLFAHQMDLVLTNHTPPFTIQQKAFTKPIARFEVAVYGPPSFRPLRRGFPKSLEGQPFILPTFDSKLRHDLIHFFQKNQIVIENRIETQDTAVMKLLSVQGTGLVALPEIAVAELVSDRRLVKLGVLDDVVEEIWLVASARRIEHPIAAHLMKSFRFSLPE